MLRRQAPGNALTQPGLARPQIVSLVEAGVLVGLAPLVIVGVVPLFVVALTAATVAVRGWRRELVLQPLLDWSMVAVLVGLSIGWLAVIDEGRAAERTAAVLWGMALVRSIVRLSSEGVITEYRARLGLVVLIAVFTPLAAFGTDWSLAKAPGLGAFYAVLERAALDPAPFHPNLTAGIALLLGTPLLVWALGHARLKSIAVMAGGALSLVLIYMTGSRSAMIAVAVAVAVAAMLVLGPLRRARPQWRFPIAGALILVGGIVVAAVSLGTVDTLTSRLELWSRVGEILRELPLTGTGPAQLPRVLDRLFPLFTAAASTAPHAHNVALQAWLDFGLIGLLGNGALVAVPLVANLRLAARGGGWAAALSAALLAFLLYGTADAVPIGSRAGFAYWIVIGLAWSSMSRATMPLRLASIASTSSIAANNPTAAPTKPADSRPL